MTRTLRIAPSILSADFARLGEEVRAIEKAGADLVHFDVMDNHYVPNLTIGPLVCEAIRPHVTIPIDVHLMVEPVDALIPLFAKAGANLITFHPEASRHVDRTLQLIRDSGCKAGLALNPATPLDWIEHVMERLDLVLLMGVNPGFGGQKFIPSTLGKLRQMRQRIDAHTQAGGQGIWLEVDGGVKADNIGSIVAAGADTCVAGSAVFGAPDRDGGYRGVINALRHAGKAAERRPGPSSNQENHMPMSRRFTLTHYLIEQRRRFPDAGGDFNALILDVALACKAIARSVARGELGAAAGQDGATPGSLNVHGETQKRLDLVSNQYFTRMNEWGGHLAGMVSEEMDEPCQIPQQHARGKYLLVFDPLDGSSNLDVNVSVGSVFSILRAGDELVASGRDVNDADFLQPGSRQLAAGYALYGPSTMLVLSVGNGVAGFTLDPDLGEFMLTHPDLRVPAETQEFAINASNSRFWEPPVKRYVDECLAGRPGPRCKDFNMRWIASMVAEAHRILMRGGVFLYPRDTKDLSRPGRLRLLYEANPIGFIMEQAGGRASTGRAPMLDVVPESLHQRIGLVFGSSNEVDRIERYHREPVSRDIDNPLFAERSLFRA